MFLDPPIFCSRKLCRATAVETQICFDLQGGKFKSYLIPGSSVFTIDLWKLAYLISDVHDVSCRTEQNELFYDDRSFQQKYWIMLIGGGVLNTT